jgi:hypothetical protein
MALPVRAPSSLLDCHNSEGCGGAALASVLGWALAGAWTIVMLRKIAVE